MDLTEELREFREQRHRTNELAATTIEFLQAELQEAQRQRDDLLTALQAVMGDHIGHVPTEVYCEWCMASVSCSAESRVDQVSSIEHDADCPFAAIARARSGEQGGERNE